MKKKDKHPDSSGWEVIARDAFAIVRWDGYGELHLCVLESSGEFKRKESRYVAKRGGISLAFAQEIAREMLNEL